MRTSQFLRALALGLATTPVWAATGSLTGGGVEITWNTSIDADKSYYLDPSRSTASVHWAPLATTGSFEATISAKNWGTVQWTGELYFSVNFDSWEGAPYRTSISRIVGDVSLTRINDGMVIKSSHFDVAEPSGFFKDATVSTYQTFFNDSSKYLYKINYEFIPGQFHTLSTAPSCATPSCMTTGYDSAEFSLFANANALAVPEPTTLSMFLVGGIACCSSRRKRDKSGFSRPGA